MSSSSVPPDDPIAALSARLADAEARAATSTSRALQAGEELARSRRENLELRTDLVSMQGETTRVLELLHHARYELEDTKRNLELIHETVSWKVTAPLRRVRRAQRTDSVDEVAAGTTEHGSSPVPAGYQPNAATIERSAAVARPFARRLAQAAALLQDAPPHAGDDPVAADLAGFEAAVVAALESGTAIAAQIAWVAAVAADGRYPTEVEWRRGLRSLRRGGAAELAAFVVERFERSVLEYRAARGGLDIRRDRVVIDIHHTAANDLHTGIQRVVREIVSRWFTRPEALAVHWNFDEHGLRALTDDEVTRLVGWRDHVHAPGSEMTVRRVGEVSADTLVPWRCAVVVPELAAEPPRCDGYRALALSGVTTGLSMVGYDIIPITAAETVSEGMPGVFAHNLSMVKHARRVSAISAASALDYSSFGQALASQGLAGPEVVAHLLPGDPPNVEADAVRALRDDLSSDLPLVLVVGSHEPRKNHLTVLEAAESLWQGGLWFDLVFMGGSGWRGEEFDDEVARLVARGFPVHVRKRVSEAALWAGYSLARFTVFPSIVEGFGLPITESLSCGTPVITSDYGSMAEVAAGGGTLLVDPRDPRALAEAMRRLLVDDAELERLALEARGRTWKTWDQYADEVWSFFTAR